MTKFVLQASVLIFPLTKYIPVQWDLFTTQLYLPVLGLLRWLSENTVHSKKNGMKFTLKLVCFLFLC